MRGSAALVLVVLGGLVTSTTSHPSRDVRVGSTGTTVAFDSTTTTVAASRTLPDRAAGEDGSSSSDPLTASGGQTRGVSGGDRVAASQVQNNPLATPTPVAEPQVANQSTGAMPAPSRASTKGATTTSGSVSTGSSPGPRSTSFDAEGGTIEVQHTDTSMNLSTTLQSPGWSIAETNLDGSNIEVSSVPESGGGDSNDINVHLDGGEPVVDRPQDATASVDRLPGG